MSEEVLEIPLDWEVITLGELNTLKSRTLLPESFPEEIFEYYSIPDYQNGELPGRVPGKSIASAKLVLKPRSVLFGKLNPRVEKVWRVGPQSGLRQIGSTEWIPVLPDDRMDPDFLFFLQWSDHVMPKAKTMVSGSTPSRQRVDPTSFYKIRVPLPPLPEQRRIAHVLSTVQEAIAQQEKLIRTTTELKQALMQKLFTEGLRGEPLKETEIGMVP
ncbi:MAG: restriction endonuclease subunit S, partial [Bacteroidota bacterium]